MTQDNQEGVDKEKLQRKKGPVGEQKPKPKPKPKQEPVDVAAGVVGSVIDLIGNPSREKIRDVTSITPMQARQLPQLDVEDTLWQHYIEIATYRQDASKYEEIYEQEMPTYPDLMEIYIYRLAQWLRSEKGLTLGRMMDLALAEAESKMGDDDEFGKGIDPYGKD